MANVSIVGNHSDEKPIYLVTNTIMGKSGSAIDADINEAGFGTPDGTIIITAGIASAKQKGLDGSWTDISL